MKELHMDPKFREAIEDLYKDLENVPDSEYVRQILELAFKLDKDGEFWKFKEVFGKGDDYRFRTAN